MELWTVVVWLELCSSVSLTVWRLNSSDSKFDCSSWQRALVAWSETWYCLWNCFEIRTGLSFAVISIRTTLSCAIFTSTSKILTGCSLGYSWVLVFFTFFFGGLGDCWTYCDICSLRSLILGWGERDSKVNGCTLVSPSAVKQSFESFALPRS